MAVTPRVRGPGRPSSRLGCFLSGSLSTHTGPRASALHPSVAKNAPGCITTSGVITEFPVGTHGDWSPSGIALGSDRNLTRRFPDVTVVLPAVISGPFTAESHPWRARLTNPLPNHRFARTSTPPNTITCASRSGWPRAPGIAGSLTIRRHIRAFPPQAHTDPWTTLPAVDSGAGKLAVNRPLTVAWFHHLSWSGAQRLTQAIFAQLAQLVEHFHGKEGVSGSSPLLGFT